MEHPQWTERLSVGLDAIDAQHKQLFAISEALHSALLSGQGKEAVKKAFKDLEAYTTRHFTEEEDFMRSIGYPDIEAHKTQHEQLLLRCRMLWNLDRRNDPIKPEGVAFFLAEWLDEHVSTSDKAIGDFVRSRK
ncbi:bacteriohemerythrin [Pseudodesulfovibrio portus]|uniref:Bacteriohemerythrin n=1 Tax=Pseudodesulfovibrio portus TaxID=231439 RepID=A0ABM8AQI6_9BACT|nr:hemerythrin family protein [Pseudodesulfovibrio portus]BDQ33558.1 bacteriohemerythrin [Pseudodesulfovibrio portus]